MTFHVFFMSLILFYITQNVYAIHIMFYRIHYDI